MIRRASNKLNRMRRRGIALMLVIMVMGVAAILAYAMLAGSALQATASSNDISVAVAQAEAESGIHLAMYYLLNSGNAPSLVNGHWPGGSNITFSSGAPATTMQGNVTVSVSDPVSGVYTVTSVGSSGAGSAGEAVTRTITAQVKVITSFVINQAAAFNSSVTVHAGVNFNGSPTALVTTGTVNLSGGSITGNVYAASVVGGTPSGSVYASPSVGAAPQAGTVADYSQPYTYQGQTYSPTKITSPISVSTTLSPTPTNPLGIYWCSGTLTVTAPLNVTGTLAVPTGKLVNKSSISASAVSGSPALVIGQTLEMNGAGRTLNVSGVVCVGTGLTGVANSAATNININGALLITSGGIVASYTGHMTVTYNATLATAPNLSTSNQTPTGVRIVGWKE